MLDTARVYLALSIADDTPSPFRDERKILDVSAVKEDILNKLRQAGHYVFCDSELINAPRFDEVLRHESISCDVMIILISKYVLQHSKWTPRVINMAHAHDVAFIPIIVERDITIEDVGKSLFLTNSVIYQPHNIPNLMKNLSDTVIELARMVREIRLKRRFEGTLLGVPLTTEQFQNDAFMIMPFSEEVVPQDIYKNNIIRVINDVAASQNLSSLTIKRGDDPFSKQGIMTGVWSQIFNARFVIADCTGRNPNVFYELGIAHTLDKPVIMIVQELDDIPFDVRGQRVIVYKPTKMTDFENQLKDAIKAILAEIEA